MARNLKFLGVGLAAACMAMTLVSSASAGELTSTGKVKLSGGGTFEEFAFEGQLISCFSTHVLGNSNETPHGFVSPPIATLTDQPAYSQCTAHIGAALASATVTMNGCDYLLHIGSKISSSLYNLTADIVCPENSQIEIHAYSSVAHTTSICTYKFPPQTGRVGAHIENTGSGEVFVGGSIIGIKATRTGILCGGTLETSSAEIRPFDSVFGRNEAAELTSISVSGS